MNEVATGSQYMLKTCYHLYFVPITSNFHTNKYSQFELELCWRESKILPLVSCHDLLLLPSSAQGREDRRSVRILHHLGLVMQFFFLGRRGSGTGFFQGVHAVRSVQISNLRMRRPLASLEGHFMMNSAAGDPVHTGPMPSKACRPPRKGAFWSAPVPIMWTSMVP